MNNALSNFPQISVTPQAALVNGRLATARNPSVSNDRGPTNLTEILNRLAALERRLDFAKIDANCSDGTVTVVLSI